MSSTQVFGKLRSDVVVSDTRIEILGQHMANQDRRGTASILLCKITSWVAASIDEIMQHLGHNTALLHTLLLRKTAPHDTAHG